MTADVVAPVSIPLPAEGRSRGALTALGALARRGLRFRLRCLLLGHEDTFARQPRRLLLRCAACGRETPGWAIGPSTAVTTASRLTTSTSVRAAHDTALRMGPWTLSGRNGRGERRERERQRLVAAAARAAEPRAPDEAPRRPAGLELIERRPGPGVANEAAGPVRAVAKRLA
jgi:hypothetical protein